MSRAFPLSTVAASAVVPVPDCVQRCWRHKGRERLGPTAAQQRQHDRAKLQRCIDLMAWAWQRQERGCGELHFLWHTKESIASPLTLPASNGRASTVGRERSKKPSRPSFSELARLACRRPRRPPPSAGEQRQKKAKATTSHLEAGVAHAGRHQDHGGVFGDPNQGDGHWQVKTNTTTHTHTPPSMSRRATCG